MLKIITCSILISLSLFGAKIEKKAVSTPLVKEKIQPIQKTTIEGQGFLKTRGGEIKTCSSESVYLYTIENYEKFIAKEQYSKNINKLKLYEYYAESFEKYKNDRNMYDHVLKNINKAVYEMRTNYPDLNITGLYDETQYQNDLQKIREYENNKISKVGEASLFIETMCDASGNFIVKNVPFGTYGIVTKATWERVEAGGRYTSPYTVTEGGKIGKIIDVNDNLQKVYITETIR